MGIETGDEQPGYSSQEFQSAVGESPEASVENEETTIVGRGKEALSSLWEDVKKNPGWKAIASFEGLVVTPTLIYEAIRQFSGGNPLEAAGILNGATTAGLGASCLALAAFTAFTSYVSVMEAKNSGYWNPDTDGFSPFHRKGETK